MTRIVYHLIVSLLLIALVLPFTRSTHAEPPVITYKTYSIGQSVQGRPLVVHQLGDGPVHRALIGAIHGGSEWNTAVLMTRTLAYLLDNPSEIPADITLYILPIANPDGYTNARGSLQGRVNANAVDLNRNWDYKWQTNAFHGQRPISGGTKPFSEPETRALRDLLVETKISDVIIYHSAYPAVFAGAGITQSRSVDLALAIAEATGYPYRPEGIPNQLTTGNAIDWLTVQGINAIEVELTNRSGVDWPQNLRGVRAFLKWRPPNP
jgi:hypothetical protein